jgi:hypothetical protein
MEKLERESNMKDDLNIRQLYQKIIEERAAARGVILMENVKIPSNNSSPDQVKFDGDTYSYESGEAFSIIGDTLYHTEGTHPYIFNSLSKIDSNPKDFKRILKSYYVEICGNFNKSDLDHFFDKQKAQSMGDTRINTQSGRIWKDRPSVSAKKDVSVVVFWCREKDIQPDTLKKIKKCFTKNDIFWAATDSKNFNHFGDSYQDTPSGEIKELKSRIYPELSHEDIVDILMRAHSNFKISPFEKKVVWEFRGINPEELKVIDGGYPSVAEFRDKQKFSEGVE